MHDFWEGVFAFLLLVLLAVAVALVLVWFYDQSTGSPVVYHSVSVVDKNYYTTTTWVYVGKIWVPISDPHWELIFSINGQSMTGEVSPTCFSHESVGDKMDVKVVTGKFTTGVYPACP